MKKGGGFKKHEALNIIVAQIEKNAFVSDESYLKRVSADNICDA